MVRIGSALWSAAVRWILPPASSPPAVRPWQSSQRRSTSGPAFVDGRENVGGADVSGCLPTGLLHGSRHGGLRGLFLDQAAEVCLQGLAGLRRADLHGAYRVVGDIPDGKRSHEVILASLTT